MVTYALAKRKRLLIGAAVIALIHFAWLVVHATGTRALFVPSIVDTYSALFALMLQRGFWLDLGFSTFRVIAGFLLSFLVAYPLVLASMLSTSIREGIFFAVEFFRYLPVPVFVPLTILWFGVGDSGKIAIVWMGTFAQMIPMFYDSAAVYLKKHESMRAALRWSPKDLLIKVVIPGSAPGVWDGMRICLGWAWTYLIVAELMGAENGLGYAVIRAQRYLATDRLFAYIIVIGLVGIASDRLMKAAKSALFKWEVA
jgi:NitT/TauT family transport system permease protein